MDEDKCNKHQIRPWTKKEKKKTGLFETNEFLLRGKIFLSAIRVFFFRRGSDTGEDLQ